MLDHPENMGCDDENPDGHIFHDTKQSFRTDALRGRERRKKETKDGLMSYTEAMKSTPSRVVCKGTELS